MNDYLVAKKAILIISFGTTYKKTRTHTIDAIETQIQNEFKDYTLKRAFTSKKVIKILHDRDNLFIDTVSIALDKLYAKGYTHVFCQPTHIMNGHEYDGIVSQIKGYEEKFAVLKLGLPLLSNDKDYDDIILTLKKSMPKLSADDALLLIGHGSTHHANSTYSALSYRFLTNNMNNVFLGTVEGFPDFDIILPQIKKLAPKKIILTPFMIVAGDHAINDIASDNENSWSSKLHANGFVVENLIKGLGEYKEIRNLYVNRIKNMINL